MWNTVGQKRAITFFESSFKRGRMPHAYLLVGPAHVGKMTLARDLAMALNCQRGVPPCGQCADCQRTSAGTHSDVQVIGLGKNADGKPQTEIGVEDIRQVQHSANLPPFEGKYKVFIIDGAENLSIEASNCLLKTLEEPAATVVFALLTAREELLPVTVVSRCQRIELTQLPSQQVESALIEKWSVEAQKARLLSRLSHGRLGWAVSSIQEGSLDRHNEVMDEIEAAIDGSLEVRFAYAAQLATEFSQSREKVQEKLGSWLDWWHDVLLTKAGLSDTVVNVDRTGHLAAMANRLTLEEIRACVAGVSKTAERLKENANARLALEVFMLRLPGAGQQAKVTAKAG